MKIETAVREYLIEIEVRKYTPRTIKGYRTNLNLFLRFCKEKSMIEEAEDISLGVVKRLTQFLTGQGKKTTELVNSIERLKTWQEYREDCDKRWKLVTQWSKKENCILSPELFRLGLYVTKDTYQKWSEQYCYSSGERLPNERATMEQESMYDNYQTFIRQLTICECSKSEEFCLPENIPNTYDIFTDWTYRRTYNELDKKWKGMILGWEQVRQELYFKVIDKEGALKYLARYSPELAFELGCEYILYMDEHMDKEKLYYPPNYTFDFNGIISNDESNRLFPLLTSKSASKLHNNMKKHFHLENTNGTTPPLR